MNFYVNVKAAEAHAETDMVAVITAAAPQDWRAAAFTLSGGATTTGATGPRRN